MPRPAAPVTGSWTLRFDDGRHVGLTRFALIGREPQALPTDPPAQLIVVADPDHSISKTHLAVGVDAAGIWVADRYSTNGSVVVSATGERDLDGGVVARLQRGDTIRFGDRSMTVEG